MIIILYSYDLDIYHPEIPIDITVVCHSPFPSGQDVPLHGIHPPRLRRSRVFFGVKRGFLGITMEKKGDFSMGFMVFHWDKTIEHISYFSSYYN